MDMPFPLSNADIHVHYRDRLWGLAYCKVGIGMSLCVVCNTTLSV